MTSVHECYGPGPGSSSKGIRKRVSASDGMGNVVGTGAIAEVKVLHQPIGSR